MIEQEHQRPGMYNDVQENWTKVKSSGTNPIGAHVLKMASLSFLLRRESECYEGRPFILYRNKPVGMLMLLEITAAQMELRAAEQTL